MEVQSILHVLEDKVEAVIKVIVLEELHHVGVVQLLQEIQLTLQKHSSTLRTCMPLRVPEWLAAAPPLRGSSALV